MTLSTMTNSSSVGYPTSTFIMNRSTWASGSGYVPSVSMGFWWLTPTERLRTRWLSPAIVTCRSCITSSNALHLRRSPVDLIGKKEIGEDGTQRGGKVTGLLVVDARSHQIRRDEIRRELNSPERPANGSGECLDGKGLGEPRDALDEQVSLRQDGTNTRSRK